MYLRNLLQGGVKGDLFVQVKDLGDDPKYRPDPRGSPPQGGSLPGGDETAEGRHGKVGIPAFGGSNSSNGARVYEGICPPPSEHHITLHCEPANTIVVSGSVEEARSTCYMTVVVTGGY